MTSIDLNVERLLMARTTTPVPGDIMGEGGQPQGQSFADLMLQLNAGPAPMPAPMPAPLPAQSAMAQFGSDPMVVRLAAAALDATATPPGDGPAAPAAGDDALHVVGDDAALSPDGASAESDLSGEPSAADPVVGVLPEAVPETRAAESIDRSAPLDGIGVSAADAGTKVVYSVPPAAVAPPSVPRPVVAASQPAVAPPASERQIVATSPQAAPARASTPQPVAAASPLAAASSAPASVPVGQPAGQPQPDQPSTGRSAENAPAYPSQVSPPADRSQAGPPPADRPLPVPAAAAATAPAADAPAKTPTSPAPIVASQSAAANQPAVTEATAPPALAAAPATPAQPALQAKPRVATRQADRSAATSGADDAIRQQTATPTGQHPDRVISAAHERAPDDEPAADAPTSTTRTKDLSVPQGDGLSVVRQEQHFGPVVTAPAPALQIAERVVQEADTLRPAAAERPSEATTVVQNSGPVIKVLHIKLQPEGLGTVTVHMTMIDDALGLEVQVMGNDVADSLRNDADTLSRHLSAAGYAVDSLKVQVAEPDRAPVGRGADPYQQGASGQSGGQAGGSASGSGSQSGNERTGSSPRQDQQSERNQSRESLSGDRRTSEVGRSSRGTLYV